MPTHVTPTTAVFGSSGFIGRNILNGLRSSNQNALGVARVTCVGQLGFDLINPDISHLALKARGVTHAIIAAAVTGISACEKNPTETRKANVEGTVELGRQLGEDGIKIIAFSSDYVFDGIAGNYDEKSTVNPLNEYGRQKAEMEARLMQVCGDNVLILRLSKVYDLLNGSGTLLDEMVTKLMRNECLFAAGDQVFCPTCVNDVVSVVSRLLTMNASGLLHVAAPLKISRFALAQLVVKEFGLNINLVNEISLCDLQEGFARPLNTSLVSKMLNQLFCHKFKTVQEGITKLKFNYGV